MQQNDVNQKKFNIRLEEIDTANFKEEVILALKVDQFKRSKFVQMSEKTKTSAKSGVKNG